MVELTMHQVETKGQGDVRDLTPLVARGVKAAPFQSGLATIAVVGSTAGITTIEFEPGAVADFNRAWEQIAEPRPGGDARAVAVHPFRGRPSTGRDVAADRAGRVRHAASHARGRRAADWISRFRGLSNAQCSMLNAQCSMLNGQWLNGQWLNGQWLNGHLRR